MMNQTKGEVAAQKYQQENMPVPPPGTDPNAVPGVAPAPAVAAPPAGTAPAQDPSQKPPWMERRDQRSKLLVAAKRSLYGGRSTITEKEMFAGKNRESEKRAEAKLEQVLKNDKVFANRLLEISSLLQDIRSMTGKR
jgi:hypothetical protein